MSINMKEEDTSMNLPDGSEASPAYLVHVEVRISHKSSARPQVIRRLVEAMIAAENGFKAPSDIDLSAHSELVSAGVERIHIAELGALSRATGTTFDFEAHNAVRWVSASEAAVHIHVYQCSDRDETEEYTPRGEEGEEIMAASDRSLPSEAWEGLWDSLVYPDDVKKRLLDYIYTTIIFSDAGVDQHIVAWNRLVLLHGPPGSGKTSLAHALAQKLAIRLRSRYSNTRMLEINSHSLFSRWFSESGKLVQKLFAHIFDVLEEEDSFVVVLIDEVESLTAARAGAMAGSEPSDAVRVVNALLTQLDKLRQRKNVLVMATSNLPNAIDTAFVDRADIVQFIGLPPPVAVYTILRSCLCELMQRGIVRRAVIPTFDEYANPDPRHGTLGKRLMAIAHLCHAQDMSGRALRRLPVLAHTRYVGASPALLLHVHRAAKRDGTVGGSAAAPVAASIGVEQWLDAMTWLVAEQAEQKAKLDGPKTESVTTTTQTTTQSLPRF